MKNTQQIKGFTKEEIDKRAKVGDLFQEILELVRNNFIGTYDIKDHSIIMRIPNGQKFRISLEEMAQ